MINHQLLAIDAGQTAIRALFTDTNGRAHALEFDGIRTDSRLIPQLATIVARVSSTLSTHVDVVSAGVSGLVSDDSLQAELWDATSTFGVKEVHLAHDSVTSYLGALGDDRGVVVAAGTGVVSLAVGARSVARIDGWGNLIGDAGSGYWIGRAALDAAMRAYDGRGAATAIMQVMQHEFPDLETAYMELQADPGRVRRIAAYSRFITELSPTDSVARLIVEEAAAELVLAAATGLSRVGEDEEESPVVCGIGGVLNAPEIRSRFDRGLRDRWPLVDIRLAVGNGLTGATLLPLLSPDGALRSHVSSFRSSITGAGTAGRKARNSLANPAQFGRNDAL